MGIEGRVIDGIEARQKEQANHAGQISQSSEASGL
jgi:hypothetical protein